MTVDAPELPPELIELAHAIADRGGRAFLVGGGVRDHLMRVPVKDWDVEVFGVPANALVGVLRERGHVNTVGRAFGVLKWRPRGMRDEEIDVSIPRRDSKVGPGHRGIQVEGDPDMPMAEAARRRDLTINALMWDIAAGRLEDPAGGLADLRAKRLRAVDDGTFLEDPLRALRVVQFAARLGDFAVDPGLAALCRRASLSELPAERIQGEWGKLLLRSARPSVGLRVARVTNILERVFPQAAALQTDDTLDALAAGPRSALAAGPAWALMLAGWLHSDAAAVTPTLDRLWIHTVGGYPVRERVTQAVAEVAAPLDGDAALRHLSTRAEVRLVIALQSAVRGVSLAAETARAETLGVSMKKPPPLLHGRDLGPLGVPPGRGMGQLLQAVYTAQLDGRVRTTKEALALAGTLHRA